MRVGRKSLRIERGEEKVPKMHMEITLEENNGTLAIGVLKKGAPRSCLKAFVGKDETNCFRRAEHNDRTGSENLDRERVAPPPGAYP
jgi:hypothetical protein